jgi:hypothetical protein
MLVETQRSLSDSGVSEPGRNQDQTETARSNASQHITQPNAAIGGGGGGAQIYVTWDQMRGMIKDSEERTLSRVASLESQINTKLEAMPTTKTIWFSTLTGVGTILGFLFAVYQIAGDRFDTGLSVGGSVGSQINSNRQDIENLQKSQSEQSDKILEAISGIQRRIDKDAATK